MLKPQRVRPLSDEGFDARCKHKYEGMPCMTKDNSVPLDKPGTLIISQTAKYAGAWLWYVWQLNMRQRAANFPPLSKGLSPDRQRQTGWHKKTDWPYKTTQEGGIKKKQSETDSSAFWAEDRLLEKREQLRRQTEGDWEQTKSEKVR